MIEFKLQYLHLKIILKNSNGGYAMKNKEGKKLMDELMFKYRNVWEVISEKEREELFSINEDYKDFLNEGKTERESAREIIKRAKKSGFKSLNEVIKSNEKLVPGMKLYANNKDKGVALFVLGRESIEKGMNIVGSHIDSPRLDLKQNPLYQDSEMAFLKTHYYGGIRKYQWVSLPLALHGVVIKKDGENAK